MSISWNDIVTAYLSQPWWIWVIGLGLICFGIQRLYKGMIGYAERPVITSEGFGQSRVYVDYQSGTIRLPRGNTYPVSHIRGLRWEDFYKSGFFHAYIEIDDLAQPIHPVLFSTSDGPEKFVARLRTAIEQAGGIRFSPTAADRFDLLERDFSNPVTAATATRVAGQARRVSFRRTD